MRQVGKVSYCGTCDGAFYKDKDVLAVGGGNTAVEEAAYLATRFTRKLTLIHRRREFRAQQVLVEELHEAAKTHDIDIKLPYVLESIEGDAQQARLDRVVVRNVETGAREELNVDGVFVFVGMVPNTGFLDGFVELNDQGYVECDLAYLRTSVPGVFVAGDCRVGAAMQLATACGDGVACATLLKQYFRDPAWWETRRVTQPEGW